SIAEHLTDRQSLGIAMRAKANTLYAQGSNALAVEMHEKAIAIFAHLGNTSEEARTLSGSIQPLILIGEYEKAFSAGERARKILTDEGNRWRLARLEINIGNIYYRQDRFAEALESYQKAYEEIKNEDDAEGIAAALSNLATCHISLNQFPEALAAY